MPVPGCRAARAGRCSAGGAAAQRGASFPEILLMVGLFSLLATFIVPAVMNWFQNTEVSRSMRSDCQTVILESMRGAPSAQSQEARDCPRPVGVIPSAPPVAPASTGSAATATGAADGTR